jgi:GT2 family glycosyltransferase
LVLLLNTDVRPLPVLLTMLSRYFGRDDTFFVSPIIESAKDDVQDVSFCIPFVKRGRVHYRKWGWEKVVPRLPRPLITMWTSGGSMLVNRSKFIELGGFDHVFKPFYREDVDLSV